jgi:PAS domain S-box-containing protein
MRLSSLIDEYKACEKALYRAIRSEQVAAIREYDIRMNWLRNVIRDFSAPSTAERMLQVSFFLEAVSQASDISPHSALFADVRAVIERYLAETRGQNAPETSETISTVRANGPELVRAPDRRRDITAMIESTDLRVSAFDRNFRYTYTSPANSRFHDIPQDAFRGKHVTEMIGEDRFEKRAKAYFEKCLSGEDQCYYYYLDSEKRGRQLLECRMLRQADTNDKALGALIVMRDLTDGFADPVKSAEENRI